MKAIERDHETRSADIRRAMRYSYRASRKRYHKGQALALRLILAVTIIYATVTAITVLV